MSADDDYDDDDKFTPTKHLILPPHHSSRPAAAHTDTETPLQYKEGYGAVARVQIDLNYVPGPTR